MKHLRELAKDFAQGKINQDDYRKQRTSLVQGILAGNISVPDREFLAPLPPPDEDPDITAQGYDYDPSSTTEIAVTKPGQKNRDVSATPAPPPPMASKHSPVLLFTALSVAVLLIIVAVTALFIFTSDSKDTVPAPEQTVQAPVAGQAASQLIQIFIEQNNWQPDKLKQFEEHWQQIGPVEQRAASGLPIMGQLVNAIYKQILEERAMATLGDAEASRRKQQILVDFANNLGIHDPKISVGR
ncbi:MAG: hypothetical protein MI673_03575 [Thiotrichales bacterium]|nr:hypothetical protein [Thiotrichales bacterium]